MGATNPVPLRRVFRRRRATGTTKYISAELELIAVQVGDDLGCQKPGPAAEFVFGNLPTPERGGVKLKLRTQALEREVRLGTGNPICHIATQHFECAGFLIG